MTVSEGLAAGALAVSIVAFSVSLYVAHRQRRADRSPCLRVVPKQLLINGGLPAAIEERRMSVLVKNTGMRPVTIAYIGLKVQEGTIACPQDASPELRGGKTLPLLLGPGEVVEAFTRHETAVYCIQTAGGGSIVAYAFDGIDEFCHGESPALQDYLAAVGGWLHSHSGSASREQDRQDATG